MRSEPGAAGRPRAVALVLQRDNQPEPCQALQDRGDRVDQAGLGEGREIGQEQVAQPGDRHVVGRQERGVFDGSQLLGFERSQGRLEQPGDAGLGVPDLAPGGLEADLLLQHHDALALEMLQKLAIRDRPMLGHEHANHLKRRVLDDVDRLDSLAGQGVRQLGLDVDFPLLAAVFAGGIGRREHRDHHLRLPQAGEDPRLPVIHRPDRLGVREYRKRRTDPAGVFGLDRRDQRRDLARILAPIVRVGVADEPKKGISPINVNAGPHDYWTYPLFHLKELIDEGHREGSSGRDLDPSVRLRKGRSNTNFAWRQTDVNQVVLTALTFRLTVRLPRIEYGVSGTQSLTPRTHELREYVRYRRRGLPTGAGNDYDLWNNVHTAALEDHGLPELDTNGNRNLFHPEAWPFLPR